MSELEPKSVSYRVAMERGIAYAKEFTSRVNGAGKVAISEVRDEDTREEPTQELPPATPEDPSEG